MCAILPVAPALNPVDRWELNKSASLVCRCPRRDTASSPCRWWRSNWPDPIRPLDGAIGRYLKFLARFLLLFNAAAPVPTVAHLVQDAGLHQALGVVHHHGHL